MATPNWVFRRTKTFRKKFDALTPEQKTKARELFLRWKADPFSQALGVHKINRLSAVARKTVRAIHVEGNLVSTFAVNGNEIVSLDIGTEQDVYG